MFGSGFILPPGTPGLLAAQKVRAMADRAVMRRLMGNVVLIGLWYVFSLSISIVSGVSLFI